ncbi:MAG: tRNA (guanosine(46)-N7)-methyltransferase TrmB [Chthoniobacterales bacterium]
MRGASKLSPEAALLELIPAGDPTSLNFTEIFGRSAPLEIDLGCGDGTFLTALAKEQPERNFIGVERMYGRSRSACRKLASLGLTNTRLLRAEISDLLEHLVSACSVDSFHLMFPDPWPKRRHESRRVVTRQFLRLIHVALRPDGMLRIATDQPDYFEQIDRMARTSENFEIDESGSGDGLPKSAFQQRYERDGADIYRVVMRKVSFVR